MPQRYWTEELIYAALYAFVQRYGLPLTLHRYRQVRRTASDKFAYPSHEIVYQLCGNWRTARTIVEKKAAIEQVQTAEVAQ